MQNAPDTLLTLIAPTALEEPLADLLIAMPELAHGFTCGPVEGRGVNVPLVGADESVRGRGKRIRIDIALDSAARGRCSRRCAPPCRGPASSIGRPRCSIAGGCGEA